MAVIHAPNESYTGTSASVDFCNGKGSTDNPHLIQWFKEHGYRVEEADLEKRKPRKKKDDVPMKKDGADDSENSPEDGTEKDGAEEG